MSIYHPVWRASQNPPLATAIGDVILAWAQAENAQLGLFAALLKMPHAKAHRLYQKLPNFRTRTTSLLTMIDLTQDYGPIKRHVIKLSQLSKKRNEMVHGSFLISLDKSHCRLVNLDEPVESDNRSKLTKAHDIHGHAEAVRSVSTTFDSDLWSIAAYRDFLVEHHSGLNANEMPRNEPPDS